MRLFNNMIKTIFPWFNSKKANKKVKAKIDAISSGNFTQNVDYMKDYQHLKCKEVEDFFNKTLDVKKSLEDKLKTSLFSVTIGITVLTSAISFLYSDGISSLNITFKGIIFTTGSIAIIYMIIAGIFAVKTISGFISVYQLFPEDLANKSYDEKKESIAVCAELNSLSNIIRQNLMSVSYHSIIISLIVITIFFFLIGIASFFQDIKIKNPSHIEVTVQPNQNSIDLIYSKINMQNEIKQKSFESLKNEIKVQNQYINSLNKKIKELNEIVTRNKQETNNQIHDLKNSNKTLEQTGKPMLK